MLTRPAATQTRHFERIWGCRSLGAQLLRECECECEYEYEYFELLDVSRASL